MAAPATPSAEDLALEGLKRAGNISPSAAELNRAAKSWLEEIKTDIWGRCALSGIRRLRGLAATKIGISEIGQIRLGLPEDYSQVLTVELLDGNLRPTIHTADVESVTIEAADPFFGQINRATAFGRELLVVDGTGKTELRSIVDVSAGSDFTILSVEPDFNPGKVPQSADKILVVNFTQPLSQCGSNEVVAYRASATPGRPMQYFIYENELIFDRPFDLDTYGIRLRYYLDITQVDVDSDRMAALRRRWRVAFVKGVYKIALQQNSDVSYRDAAEEYEAAIASLLCAEQDPTVDEPQLIMDDC